MIGNFILRIQGHLKSFVALDIKRMGLLSSLCFLPLCGLFVWSAVGAFYPQCIPTGRWNSIGRGAIFLTVLFEATGYALMLFWFLLATVIQTQDDRLGTLMRCVPKYRERLTRISKTDRGSDDETKALKELTKSCLDTATVAYSGTLHLGMVPLAIVRLIIVFSCASFSLAVWHGRQFGCSQELFATITVCCPLNHFSEVINLFIQFLYFHIVTISTTGFGDIYPKLLEARILTIIEIALNTLTIAFLANVVVAVVLDNSLNREPEMVDYLRRVVDNNIRILHFDSRNTP